MRVLLEHKPSCPLRMVGCKYCGVSRMHKQIDQHEANCDKRKKLALATGGATTGGPETPSTAGTNTAGFFSTPSLATPMMSTPTLSTPTSASALAPPSSTGGDPGSAEAGDRPPDATNTSVSSFPDISADAINRTVSNTSTVLEPSLAPAAAAATGSTPATDPQTTAGEFPALSISVASPSPVEQRSPNVDTVTSEISKAASLAGSTSDGGFEAIVSPLSAIMSPAVNLPSPRFTLEPRTPVLTSQQPPHLCVLFSTRGTS